MSVGDDWIISDMPRMLAVLADNCDDSHGMLEELKTDLEKVCLNLNI